MTPRQMIELIKEFGRINLEEARSRPSKSNHMKRSLGALEVRTNISKTNSQQNRNPEHYAISNALKEDDTVAAEPTKKTKPKKKDDVELKKTKTTIDLEPEITPIAGY